MHGIPILAIPILMENFAVRSKGIQACVKSLTTTTMEANFAISLTSCLIMSNVSSMHVKHFKWKQNSHYMKMTTSWWPTSTQHINNHESQQKKHPASVALDGQRLVIRVSLGLIIDSLFGEEWNFLLAEFDHEDARPTYGKHFRYRPCSSSVNTFRVS